MHRIDVGRVPDRCGCTARVVSAGVWPAETPHKDAGYRPAPDRGARCCNRSRRVRRSGRGRRPWRATGRPGSPRQPPLAGCRGRAVAVVAAAHLRPAGALQERDREGGQADRQRDGSHPGPGRGRRPAVGGGAEQVGRSVGGVGRGEDRGDRSSPGGQRAEHRDDAAPGRAQHEEGAPAGQRDEREREHHRRHVGAGDGDLALARAGGGGGGPGPAGGEDAERGGRGADGEDASEPRGTPLPRRSGGRLRLVGRFGRVSHRSAGRRRSRSARRCGRRDPPGRP